MMKCPCKGCFDRKLLCHSQCERYKAWKAELERLKAAKEAADANAITVPENVIREYWRSMRYTSRRFNRK